ncbi:MAG: hypothetical protein QME47_07090 [Candidatus Thermoplasmatota archaeon]|nr:hypothetical protein [Candidatus Thermoplasmatota archaeon]
MEITKIAEIKERYEASLLKIKGVTGVGARKDEIVVFVERTEVCDRIPKSLDGIRVKCVVTGRIKFL